MIFSYASLDYLRSKIAYLSQIMGYRSSFNTTSALLAKGLRWYVDIMFPVTIVTVVTIAVLAVPAYYLDRVYGTTPVLFVGALIASMPLSLYMVYKVIRDRLSRNLLD